ncbi:translocation and assembly module lipoprotein TamL [Chitinophaga niabensis]|uniref:Outer membrane protein assembly factor BamA n=1 Tax=Chitinophaga niabensis TaxID=536979 RepID=A0A1N6EKB7_9BACT|nr:BamA/TamA family outer membrane protein [Chitinophaga niabensis]SIN83407.1 Outer membrane protein assembly factor BamA [Chitinophaga niabensis]
MIRSVRYIPFVISILFLAACSTTRTVPEGDRLYTGADVKWKDTIIKKKPKDYSTIKTGMEERIRPLPNRRFLGMPIKLWLYNLGNEPKGKGLNYLLRKKWGEAPVLLSQVKVDRTDDILTSYLEDNGYFNADVDHTIKNSGKKKAGITFTAIPDFRYTIHRVRFDTDTGLLGHHIMLTTRKTLLKPDDNYSLDKIKEERERIHAFLKENGFYYFTPDYLLIRIDSALGKHQVDLYLTTKKTTPPTALRQYYMKNVELFTNYDLAKDSAQQFSKGVQYQNFTIIDPDSLFKPIVFDRTVFLQRDSMYRLSSHNITLQRLVNLGTFKFVRGNFRPARDSSLLYARFFLTPYPKRSLQVEVSGTSKSNSFVGSQLKLSAKNRNFQRKANLLEISLGGGFETQVGGKTTQVSTNAYSLNGEVSITIPRFFTPVIRFNPRTPYVPRTRFSLGYEMLSRPNLYNLNAFNLQYGYIWKQTKFLDHALYPVAITYVLPSSESPEFLEQKKQDPALAQSISKQFILGSNYTLTYNNQSPEKYHSFYAYFNTDVAGNLVGLFAKKQPDGKKTIINNDFSQYIRFSVDGRHYFKLSDNLRWVNRLFAGYGIAYGNSTTLPFVKQFFNGGSNSLRAFRARTLGPGSYRDAPDDPNNPGAKNLLLANAAGDIKLEGNTELRYKPTSLLEFAAFVDAGNIWLGKTDSASQEPKVFKTNRFLKELAVGTGLGIRIDASILLVRFDISFPLRKPWLPENERWVFKQIALGDPDWRKENLILNIAIGYPF